MELGKTSERKMERIFLIVLCLSWTAETEGRGRGLFESVNGSTTYRNAVNITDFSSHNRTTDVPRVRNYEKLYYIFCVAAASGAICIILYSFCRCFSNCLLHKQSSDLSTQETSSGIPNEAFVSMTDEGHGTTNSNLDSSPPDYHSVVNGDHEQRTSVDYHRKSIEKGNIYDDEPPPPYDSLVNHKVETIIEAQP